MDQPDLNCANCGKELPELDGICPQCDFELSASFDPSRGKYRCPNCNSRFDLPNFILWPPQAPWYWPQENKPQCPYCSILLQDRVMIIAPYIMIIQVIAGLAIDFIYRNSLWLFLSIAFIIGLSAKLLNNSKLLGYAKEDRYILDKSI